MSNPTAGTLSTLRQKKMRPYTRQKLNLRCRIDDVNVDSAMSWHIVIAVDAKIILSNG